MNRGTVEIGPCRGGGIEQPPGLRSSSANAAEVFDLSRWECAADAYAHLQIDWVERTDELLALGCQDRTLAKLEGEIDPLLADTAALLPGQPEGLSAVEITRLRARAPEFKAMCHDLAQYAIPPSLEHGDLWGVNVIASEA